MKDTDFNSPMTNVTFINIFRTHAQKEDTMLHIKLMGIDPSGGVKRSKNFFTESSHVAYQIKIKGNGT